MSSFTPFNGLAQELQDHILDQALLEEIENRFVLVHRVSMKVLPHKRTTRSAIMGVDKQRRAYALRWFYDVQLEVWTFPTSTDYSRAFDIFCRFPYGLEGPIQQGMTPLRMAQGVYGPAARNEFRECFWEYRLRGDLHQHILSQLQRAPSRVQGSVLKGKIYLSSQFDKFALSNNIEVRQPTYYWHVDLCINHFLRNHERHIRGVTRSPNDYNGRDMMSVRIPRRAMDRIRRVVSTYYFRGLEPEHLPGANQLFTANMQRIPAASMSFQASQRLIEWKRTDPPAALPFVCACPEAEEEEEESEEGSSIVVATPDDE
ncbi:hypothetical protein PG988_004584 [Apiospora saccharicola]